MKAELHEISVNFGTFCAVNNVSLSFAPGEIHALVGENGAGKSTLMKIICGSLKQDKGEVSICKINSKKNMLLVKSKIGYLSEKNPT